MVLIALSFQGQVEKYGVYVGIAAFFGLAVLSLLYFAQARELKRLREWAGRAPERARELEQRVVAQATANVARRTPPMPGAPAKGVIAPPRRLAEMPVPAPAERTATELAEPEAPGEAEEQVANGSAPVAPPADGPPPAGDAPEVNGAAAPDAAAPEQTEPEEQEEVAEGDGTPAVAAAAAAGPAAEGTEAGTPADAPRAPQPEESGAEAGPTPGEREQEQDSGTRPGEVPLAVPRVTPAQRVGVTPRPAAMPLRQSNPSATPAPARGAGRRPPGAPAASRAPGAPREGRSAGTIALLVGLAVLVLGGGTFLVSQLGGGDPEPAPNRAAPPPTQTADDGSGGASTPAETNVAVLNGTTFTGLAGQLADRISQEGGFQRGVTETNTRDQTLQSSTIYYADGFRAPARDVAELLSISALEPLDADTQSLAPDADVVVLAGADQAP